MNLNIIDSYKNAQDPATARGRSRAHEVVGRARPATITLACILATEVGVLIVAGVSMCEVRVLT
jgi:hypothetical protein